VINLAQQLAPFLKQILSLCTLLGVLWGQSVAAEAAQPNSVILHGDDMGYGDPGCYNPQSMIATPNIYRLFPRLKREFHHRIWQHYENPKALNWQSREELGNHGQGPTIERQRARRIRPRR
jgi:hypothetical protein